MMSEHKRRVLPPELTDMLGMQTNPFSPTAYILGMRYTDAVGVQLPGLDHPTCWTKKGRRVVISEPYGISYQTIRHMLEFANANGLEFCIDVRFQSWNPGRCEAVLWTKRGAPL